MNRFVSIVQTNNWCAGRLEKAQKQKGVTIRKHCYYLCGLWKCDKVELGSERATVERDAECGGSYCLIYTNCLKLLGFSYTVRGSPYALVHRHQDCVLRSNYEGCLGGAPRSLTDAANLTNVSPSERAYHCDLTIPCHM